MVGLARHLHLAEDDPGGPRPPRRVLAAIPSVSVIVVAYNAGAALTRCLDSLAGESNLEVIVVDNGDQGPEIAAASRRDFIQVLSPGMNLGFPAGCNAGARRAAGEVLVFLNPDAVVAPGAITALARTLADASVAIAMPRLRLLREPELLNSAGNVLHISGLAWAGSFGEPAGSLAEMRDIPFASGAALAVRARTFWELGGFTDELFLYQEDLELSWRAHLRGLRVVVTPAADVYHDYEYARHAAKSYYLERNRLIFVLTAFSPRLLLLLCPVLISAEIALAGLAFKEGWLGRKVAGWTWCARNVGWLLNHRGRTQRLRSVLDRDLARFLSPRIEPSMIPLPSAVRVVNPLVSLYWSLARRAL